MNIETKYGINSKVWMPDGHYDTLTLIKPCPACEGNGEIEVNGYKYTCQKCHGGYERLYAFSMAEPERYTITEVDVKIKKGESKPEVSYGIRYSSSGTLYVKEDNVFDTSEECQIKCDEINKETKDLLSNGWKIEN